MQVCVVKHGDFVPQSITQLSIILCDDKLHENLSRVASQDLLLCIGESNWDHVHDTLQSAGRALRVYVVEDEQTDSRGWRALRAMAQE